MNGAPGPSCKLIQIPERRFDLHQGYVAGAARAHSTKAETRAGVEMPRVLQPWAGVGFWGEDELLGSFDFYFFRCLLYFDFFRKRHGQYALGELCLDLVGIDAVR